MAISRLLFFLLPIGMVLGQSKGERAPWAIAIHGGAGESEWERMDASTADAYRKSLAKALAAGTRVLTGGGRAIDAVEAAINVLEDDPLFNAGRGAAFNDQGKNEMDASIMDGSTLAAGSVAGVRSTKNPITLAHAVMEKSPYVMVAGTGTDEFAKRIGLPQKPPSYFFTEMRWQELLAVLKQAGKPLPRRPEGVPPKAADRHEGDLYLIHRFGTVGAVARDSKGNIAAGTSTGGMQGKMPGRVGDSPVIGAGTYAANASCAVSTTGSGEYFIRLSVAKEVCTLAQYKGMSVQAAAEFVIHEEVAKLKGGEGGVIVLDRSSPPAWSFNTLGMFRARQTQGGQAEVKVEAEQPARASH